MRPIWQTSILIHCVFAVVLTLCPANQANAVDREYVIKAIFLYNFLNYITWPDNKLRKKDASATLCIYGQDPFGKAFSYLQKKSKNKRNLTIKKLARNEIEHTSFCHILFISDSEKNRLNEFNDKLTSSGVLTVSDIKGFAGNGGIVEFVKRNNKTKLIIDVGYLEKQGLKASSKLMKIVKVVGRKDSK